MRLEEFDYDLPKELIAQSAIEPKDDSRLLVVKGTKLEDKTFRDIVDYFQQGDVLVLNNTKVMKRKLYGKKTSGAAADVILEKSDGKGLFQCRVQTNRPNIGTKIELPDGLVGEIVKRDLDLFWLQFNKDPIPVFDTSGTLPAPNYVRRQILTEDSYQTVYASDEGSLAAPTSGLHFTKELLQSIRAKGVEIVEVTLHISFATFKPINEDISNHKMDKEKYVISKETAEKINKRKGRLVLCGTTVFKALETNSKDGIVFPGKGESDLFIFPGHRFSIKPDLMITNFHLPESTLILFISAYFGKDTVLNAYNHAVREKYRFYSLGDATLFISDSSLGYTQ